MIKKYSVDSLNIYIKIDFNCSSLFVWFSSSSLLNKVSEWVSTYKFGVTNLSNNNNIFSFIFIIKFNNILNNPSLFIFPHNIEKSNFTNSSFVINKKKKSLLVKQLFNVSHTQKYFSSSVESFKSCNIFSKKISFFFFISSVLIISSLYVKIIFIHSPIDLLFKCFINPFIISSQFSLYMYDNIWVDLFISMWFKILLK